ncbi:Zn-cluster domain [Arabidopsis thaliana x Arabidopsis arenosa]|uniref:Zn-cluster domain n=1 Tax=Arabidopsis thaliana x Arabidopsis arenosa TaxID=1240361 RepID=A0A8T1Y8G1_9BRAS|nr:Zn-cluster domain [Arabidopsis thaliana x Arabidopsis arenosa]
MAVDLMRFPQMDDQTAIQEAASQGLQSMEHLIRVLSNRPEQQHNNVDCSEITDFTVSKFKTVISLLNRTGHARFRRGPVHSTSSQKQQSQIVKTTQPVTPTVSQPARTTTTLPQIVPPPSSFVHSNQPSVTLDFSKPSIFGTKAKSSELEFSKENFSVSLNSSFMSSGITGDGSVSNGKIFLASAPSQPVNSSGKPPLAAGHPYRKRCLEHEHSESFSGKVSGSGYGKCHCKKRYCYVTYVTHLSFKQLLSDFRYLISKVSTFS